MAGISFGGGRAALSGAEMSGGRNQSGPDVTAEYIWAIIGSQNRKLKCTYATDATGQCERH